MNLRYIPPVRALLVLLALAVAAPPAAAQTPIRRPGTSPISGITIRTSLEVLVLTGTTPARQARVCVGVLGDQSKFGEALTDNSGIARFSGVTPAEDLIITASKRRFSGNVQGVRIEHRMSGTSDRVEVTVANNGPTCATPTRTKALPPSAVLGPPALRGTLRTNAGTFATHRDILLRTHAGSPRDYLEVTGRPTAFRTAQDAAMTGADWRDATIEEDRMYYVGHEITGGDGRKTIWLELANGQGASEQYSVDVDFLEMYQCRVEYERADNALAEMGDPVGDLGIESLTLQRTESKTFNYAWPSENERKRGYGMHLRILRNVGDHAFEVSFGGGFVWNVRRIEPRTGATFRADMRSLRCL